MTITRTAYTSGHFLFRLDDAPDTNWLKSVDGGGVKGKLTEESVGPDHLQLKHMAAVEIEPLTIEMGIAATSQVFRWIQQSWERDFARRNGSVIHANFNKKAVLEQQFERALITEVAFPALDGSDRNPAYLTIKLQPEKITIEPGNNQLLQGVDGDNKQKMWSPASFRFEIDGLDCSHVNKIDGFAIKQKVKPLYVGGRRYPEFEPTDIEFPNLTLTMSAAYADDFIRWHHEFVMQGGNAADHERTGTIEFLDPASKNLLFAIDLDRVGINYLTLEKSEADAESIKRCKVDLYVEVMKLVFPAQGGFS